MTTTRYLDSNRHYNCGCLEQAGIPQKKGLHNRKAPFNSIIPALPLSDISFEVVREALSQLLPLCLVFELSFLTARTSIRTTWPLEFVSAEAANVLDFLFHDSLLNEELMIIFVTDNYIYSWNKKWFQKMPEHVKSTAEIGRKN